MRSTPTREALVRICDVCGQESMCPVWLGTICGAFIAKTDHMAQCHGHFVEPILAVPEQAA